MQLPMTNISRNFPGVSAEQFYTMDELQAGLCGTPDDPTYLDSDGPKGKSVI